MKFFGILILGALLAQVPAFAQTGPIQLCKTIDNTKLDQAGQMPFKTCGQLGTIRVLLPIGASYKSVGAYSKNHVMVECNAKEIKIDASAGMKIVDLSYNLGNRLADQYDFCGLIITQGYYTGQISFAGYLDQAE